MSGSPAACARLISSPSVAVVTVNPKPVDFLIEDTSVCYGKSIDINAMGSYAGYLWSTGSRSPFITVTVPNTYWLMVTDNNGCTATQTINITSYCTDIHFPNTFTPNSDGINDTWEIKYLNTYPNTTVEVFNRYGSKVYYSNGYGVPWNGQFNGADLPVGTYYYIIRRI